MTSVVPAPIPESTHLAYREFVEWFYNQFGREPECDINQFILALATPLVPQNELAEDPYYLDGVEDRNGDYR